LFIATSSAWVQHVPGHKARTRDFEYIEPGKGRILGKHHQNDGPKARDRPKIHALQIYDLGLWLDFAATGFHRP